MLGGLGLLLFLMMVPVGWAQPTGKLVILPFKIYSSEPLDFLRESLVDMLSSRLSRPGELTVVDKAVLKRIVSFQKDVEVTADLLARLRRETGSDFVVAGSLTKLGDVISIDATLYKVPVNQPFSAVFLQAQGLSTLIPKMGELAMEITKELGKDKPSAVAEKATPGGTAKQAAPTSAGEEGGSRLAELEKRLKALESTRGQESGRPQPGALARKEPRENPEIIITRRGDKAAGDYWQSRELPFQIDGMDVGDVDGDGKNEMVIIEENVVRVYRVEAGNMAQLAQLPGERDDSFIHVDLFDIDGDGQAEIFVTNMVKGWVSSFILKLKGGRFQKIASKLPWYFASMELPNKGPVILGQEPGVTTFLGGSVYQMQWKGGKLVAGSQMEIPLGTNIYSLALGEFKEKGQVQFAALDDESRLKLYSPSGQTEWRSGELFGGTIRIIEKDSLADYGRTAGQDVSSGLRVRIHPRMLVRPSPANGVQELVVARNFAFGKGLFERTNFFTDSEIQGLTWNGLSLGEAWKTKKIDAYVTDIKIKDLDNDGKVDLIAALIIDSKGIMKKPKSAILSYRLSP